VYRTLDIGSDGPLAMFATEPKTWDSILAPVLLRHGQRVRKWQLGSVDVPNVFFMADLPQLAAAAAVDLRNLAPRPQTILPWRLDQARRPQVKDVAGYLIDVPYAVHAENLAQHLAEWHRAPPAKVTLHLREPPATQITQRDRVTDLVLRMLHGWEAGADGLAVSRPWTDAVQRRTGLLPDPLLGVFASVAHRLAGRRVVGRLDLGKGLECMIFNGPRGGMLAAWNRHAQRAEAKIDMYLGPSVQAVDVWGNRVDIPAVDGRHQWTLDRIPVFFEPIDPELALFRAAFVLDKPFIESLQMPHPRTATLANPWSRTISGHMYIIGPQKWQIEPRRCFFSIAAGQESRIPLQLVFPVSEVAGEKRLVAKFDFLAQQRYQIRLGAPMELGLEKVEFDASLAIEPGADGTANDVVVTGLVTNRGDETLALYAFANLPGFPRQERIISRLRPGQSIVRRFRFAGAADAPGADGSAQIRVGLREANGPAVLNKTLAITRIDR